MERKSKRERVARLRQDQLDELGGTQSACVRWVDDHWSGLSEADPDVPSELHDRAGDNWRPLLAIAEEAGGEWPVSAGKAARLLSGMEPDDDDNSVVLLADIRDVFEAFASDVVASQALVESLVAIAERPWAEWRGGREMSQHQLARVLKPFRIHPKQVRVDGVQKRGYRRKDFEDAWLRHLPERGST